MNPDALESHRGIVANPNCSTMQMVVALKPILDAVGIERLVITTMQSVSGTGQRAVEELHDQTEAVLDAQELPPPRSTRTRSPSTCCRRRASFPDGSDYTDEELKLVNETRKILSQPTIGVSATCTRVPVYTGHSESVNVQTRDTALARGVPRAAGAAPGLDVLDIRRRGIYPLAIEAAGRDEVLVGRIRRDPSHERCLNLFIVGDNLRKGAATNAVQLAELVVERGLYGAARMSAARAG